MYQLATRLLSTQGTARQFLFNEFPQICLFAAENNRAVYMRENKSRLTLAAAYTIRERNYLYEYKLPGQDKPQLEKAVNVDFVPFIRDARVLCKPRPG